MKHNLKAAIIGCGGISSVHISAIKDSCLGNLTAICDIDSSRLMRASLGIPGVATYSDYKELLESRRVDVVHICTPHYLHAEMAIAAMKTGHHVYLEKPAAMTAKQAEEIIKVSEETGKKVCVSFQNRLVPTTLGIQAVINSGSMGKLLGMKGIVAWCRNGGYYTDSGWRGEWEKEGGGTLMNQSIHTLDLICMLGGEIDRVEGTISLRTNAGTIEVEDTAEATIWFKNGSSAIFYATNCHTTSSSIELECVFEKGSILVRDDMLYRLCDGKLEQLAENGKPGVGKTVWGVGHLAMIDNFYSNIDGTGTPYYCDIKQGAKVLSVIEQIYLSGESAKTAVKNPLL